MIRAGNFMVIFRLIKARVQRVLLIKEVLFVYAIITTGGKQYKVQEGDIIFVEKLGVEENEKVSFDVIAVSTDDGIKTGDTGVKAEGTVLRNAKAKKVVVFKYKSKKGEKKKQGHRQPYSKVQITKIG
jgi:large subunit ribosomal protein L21